MTNLPRVLLVDDESDFLAVGGAILRKNGYDVYSLSSGQNIFELLKSYKPGLIILDVKLGLHDGRSICRQIKDNPETSGIKVILHSAFQDVGSEYHKYGAEEFILKPYTIEHLVDRISFHLKE